MKYCVIGGAGFLGSHLVDHLIDSGHEVLVLDNLITGQKRFVNPKARFMWCDITHSEDQLRKIFLENGIEYVLNYSAEPYIPVSFRRPLHVFDINARGALMVMNAAQDAGVKRILQVSSAEIYGDAPNHKIDETHPPRPHSTYGASKLAIDCLVQARFKEAGTPVIALRQFNCFSGDTDVITPIGIKNIKDLHIGDKIYTLNADTLIPEEDEVVDTQFRKEDGVCSVRHKSLDYIVTDDHRFFLKSHQRNKFHFYDLNYLMTLNNQFSFPRHKAVETGVEFNDDNKLKLLAWYITEGYFHLPYEIRICQRNVDYRKEIKELIKSFKGTCTETYHYISLSDKKLASWLQDVAGRGSINKKIPDFVFGLNLKDRMLFQETLMKGDGDKRGGRYSTISYELMNGFSRLCLVNGQSIKVTKDINRNGMILGRKVKVHPIYRIHFDRKTETTIKTKKHIKELNTKISVYDITAKKNHIILAGRNGIFNWIGQCIGERETHPYVIPEIIQQVHNIKGTNGIIHLGNDSFRDFQYAGDAVKMATELLHKGKCGEVYNMGSEIGVKIFDLAVMIGKLMGKDIKIEQDAKRIRPWEIWHLQSDNTKLYSTIKTRPQVTLEGALKKTIDYFHANGDKWDWSK